MLETIYDVMNTTMGIIIDIGLQLCIFAFALTLIIKFLQKLVQLVLGR